MAYGILFKQRRSDHVTRGRSHAVDRIVVHCTGALASAHNNTTYFSRNEAQGVSAHYFVDDITPEVYQSVAEGDTAWHAGNWDMNCRSVGIEMISVGEDYSATEIDKLAWLVNRLMAKYGIGAPASSATATWRVSTAPRPAWPTPSGRRSGRALRAGGSGAGTSCGGSGDAPSGSTAELAKRAIAGEFGNEDARRTALGGRYDEV